MLSAARQAAESLGRLRAHNRMAAQLDMMGRAVANEGRSELREMLGDDLAERFAEMMTDEDDLPAAIELFRRLSAKDATIRIDAG